MVNMVESVVDGLLYGLIYAVAAIGLTLIFGVMRVVNLAHGALLMSGMFGLFLLTTGLGVNPYLLLPALALGGVVVGLAIYYVAVARLHDAPELMSLLATFAVSVMIIGLATSAFSTTPRNIPSSLGTIELGSFRIVNNSLAAGAVSIALVVALYQFLGRARAGKQIRAVADNRAAAELVGIPSARILALAFGVGTMLAIVAGGLIATLFPFTVLSGTAYELKSFVIVVLGGLGNVTGALIGGLLLGAIEGIAPIFLPVGWVPVIEFVVFVLVLVLRPKGIFGTGR